MNTLTYVFYGAGYSLQGLLIWRACRSRAWRYYPFFCSYFMYTCFSGSVQLILALLRYPGYAPIYVLSEAVAAVLRFAVAWELYRHVFHRGSALRSIAGGVLICALILLAFAFWTSGASPGASVSVDFMRKMALSVAAWIVLVMGLARFYRIPVARNIGGMAIGFLAFSASEMADFAAFDLSPRFEAIWRYVHPFSYLCMLAVWVWSLWDYAPNRQLTSTELSIGSQALTHWQDRSSALQDAVWKVIKP